MRTEVKIWGKYSLFIPFNYRTAWWVAPYLKGVAWVARTTGVNPDIPKVTRTVMRGIHPIPVKRPRR
ncbi:hypothetical protein N5B55_10330 [Ralstonia pickettii]|uniref:hypothetical protein n=1 Tax=Ralstonia pickettii TaxID=329 RepID=UPI002714ECA2|nr:hypothetical protein [Ralstonia pickettii]WKZ84182.1 hypothetical protein N5B55_10330 [Ralstonia pickettii]